MKVTKSQTKLKMPLGKFENYFTQKNWDDPMFMDDRTQNDALDLTKRLISYSSLTIQPRAKLSLSLHDKAGAVLSDSRKIGMLQKVQSSATRKSLSKLSNFSSLPPIKTENQQVADHLRKVKNELNEVSQKCIKMQKQVTNIQASIIQIKQKSKLLHQLLSTSAQQKDKQIQIKKNIVDKLKYDTDVRFHMRDNLKVNIQAQAKSKTALQARLNQLKTQIQSVTKQLDNNMKSLNISKFNKKQYEKKANMASDELFTTSSLAEQKLQLQMNAEKLHQKLQSIEGYRQDQYNYETNLQNHFTTLKQLRVQQVLNRMLSVLFIKRQASYQQYQKSYTLMISYNSLNTSPNKTQTLRTSTKTESTVKNSSMIKNSSTLSRVENESVELAQLYRGTFQKKTQLQIKIKQKQQRVKQLQTQKQALYAKWIDKTFVDAVTEGSKPQNKADYTNQIKKLIQREKRSDDNKIVQKQVGIWLERQVQKLGLQFSKKTNQADKLIKIIQYLSTESKKVIQIKPMTQVRNTEPKSLKSKSKSKKF